MSNNDKKIVYFGTSEFAALILSELLKHYRINAVITQPDRPSGRKQILTVTPVKEVATAFQAPLFQPKNLRDESFINQIDKIKPDLGILAAYAEIIPQAVIDKFPLGILNIHPSLLPKYRGASPIQSAIFNGDKFTGVSIIKLNAQLDAGPILIQKEFPILDNDTNMTLHDKLAKVGSYLIIKILPQYLLGEIKLKVQDESQATYSKKLTKDDGQINWQKTAEEIFRQFKAFQPWPGVFTYFDSKRLQISDLEPYKSYIFHKFESGKVFLGQNGQILVQTARGVLELKKIKLEGKNEMSAVDFARGYKNFIGSVLK